MKKSDLIHLAAEKTGLSQLEVRKCLDVILGAICEELKNGGDVVITDFGRFYTKKLPKRVVKLPNGHSSVVLERENVKFKAFQNIRLYNVKY
jgi:nucleoid DNA-binding protein